MLIICHSPLCGLESKELSSGFLTVWTWCIKLKDLWLQGGGFDPWNMSIMFAGQRSSGVNLYTHETHLWDLQQRSDPLPASGVQSGRGQRVQAVSCDSDPVPRSLSGAFSLYFGIRLLNGFLIDCDPDQWLAVAGLLSQYWIYSACTASFLVWDWRRLINEAQLPLLCLHTPAISWPSQCPVCLSPHTHPH